MGIKKVWEAPLDFTIFRKFQDFLVVMMDKNPAANARDMGFIHGSGGFHVPWSS